MSAAIRTPSDDLQHIQFEGCDVCVIAPEDYDALVAALEYYARTPSSYGDVARAALKAS